MDAFAFYPYLNLPAPMMIGNASGQYGVSFTDLAEPPVLPEFTRERKMIVHEMGSPGIGKRGNRVLETYQTSPNWWNIDFVADMISPKQLSYLRGYLDGTYNQSSDPGYISFTLGDVISNPPIYVGMMVTEPKATNYRFNGRHFHKVAINLHILGVSADVTSISLGAVT